MFKKKKSNSITMTWEILTDEQKIKMVDLALKDAEITVSGCCGDVENLTIKGFKGFARDGKITVNTTNNFYSSIILSDEYVIDKWEKYVRKNKKVR